MIDLTKNKSFYIYHLLALLFVDYIIIFDILFIRQVLSILYFTIVPGTILLHILKIDVVGRLKKAVISVGLSLSFLMFCALFINRIALAFDDFKPLSTSHLLVYFNIILFFLIYYMYKYTNITVIEKKCKLTSFPDNSYVKSKYLSLALFPIIFPFMSVFGTHLMNSKSNNIILIIMLYLIPIYILSLFVFKDKTLKITYPISIYTIALSLLFMHGLTSNYLNGIDVHLEYYAARVVSTNLYWSLSNYNHETTSCLSTSLLPTVFWSLSGVNLLFVYKVIYQMIWAITPLVCYLLFENYVTREQSLLASFFFIFQMPFIFDMQSAMRTEMSLFFMSLIWLIHFDNQIDKVSKKIIFIVFMFSSSFSHYAASYLFFCQIFIFWMSILLIKKLRNIKVNHSVSKNIVLLSFMIPFLWYGLVANKTFSIFVRFIKVIFNSMDKMNNFYSEDLRAQGTYIPTTQILHLPSYKINLIIMWVTFLFIAIGVFYSFINYIYSSYKCKDKKINFDIEYITLSLIFGATLFMFLVLPFASKGYGNNRIYEQVLIILAVYFVIGGNVVFKYIYRKKNCEYFVLLILILQFFCSSLLIHQIFGVPYSEALNRNGNMYSEYYIHDEEVASARWLCNHIYNNSLIYSDSYGRGRILMGCKVGEFPNLDEKFFTRNKEISDGYIYLRYQNVVNKSIGVSMFFDQGFAISSYSHLFNKKNVIYNNDKSKIYD